MQKTFSLLGIMLVTSILAACTTVTPENPQEAVIPTSKDVTYNLLLQTDDSTKQTELTTAFKRVLDRLLTIAQATADNYKLQGTGTSRTVKFTLSDSNLAEPLLTQLTLPFSFTLMPEVPIEEADITIADTLGFKKTAFNDSHIQWADISQSNTNQSAVVLHISDQGVSIVNEIIRTYPGAEIGLFVREKIVATIRNTPSLSENKLELQEVFSPEIAEIFKDDILVSSFVSIENTAD